ncbi:MAG TPA: PhoH family protein, partial [Chitinophagaceae bacterium]|nr:PhoH family protein [Chitinophagaceae bacterium]
ITGDLTQVDLPKNQRSGLLKATSILKNIPGIGYLELGQEDVVRHRLVKEIIKAYEVDDKKQQPPKEKANQ